MKKLNLTAALISALIFMSCNQPEKLNEYEISGRTMGTEYHIKIAAKEISHGNLLNLKNEIDTLLKKFNRQVSTYDPMSEISVFNFSGDTSDYAISPEFYEIIKILRSCLRYISIYSL